MTNPADKKVLIALGSNLDDPAHNLSRAAAHLAALSTAGMHCSSIWTSSPEGFDTEVPDFCNAVVSIMVSCTPTELLQATQDIEQAFGRRRKTEQGYLSRRLDLDIIDWNREVIDTPQLKLPHPRAAGRRFVLLPLQEVEPAFRFPGRQESLDVLIRQAPQNPMVKTTRLIPSA